MAKYTPILLGLLLAITACERPAPPVSAEAEPPYNLLAYLQHQVELLEAKQPMVLKSVTTGEAPTETIETDEIGWENELAVFETADLNRSTLLENYAMEEQVLPDGNISIKYVQVEDAEPVVQYLHLVLSPDREFRQLEALLEEQNIIFFSRRKLQLSADPATGNISSYRVEGVQRLAFSDSLHYKIDANL
ncbi:hypothetical protein CLV24_103175 [Pontibacter ummariensis]|uniref:Uncharacterized protein n=2 Tax=Pontibacter ummariensis TaxID=1610492 RepID=A0A239CM50_9BACT|nr:hypothetical protein CLV24_103175 [Pontibacter ummariensis]SNS21217.1 hypothetical protein SAMN06296052_103138 [Pontibacter ummariensis]